MARESWAIADDSDQVEDGGPGAPLLGGSKVMREVREALDRVARYPWAVLLQGSTGTGKTVAASYIHMRSERRDGPFVVCPASQLMDSLALSELVGHTRGAFTGADRDYPGAFEAAHRGTLFVDDIQTASLAVQAMFLPLIPDWTKPLVVKRLGERRTRYPDVRVIAATNVDLKREVDAGRFLLDLHERLKELPVRLPDLIEHREDIPMLFRHYLSELSKKVRQEPKEPSAADWQIIKSYDWPGNVRELISVVKSYIVHGHLQADIVSENWRDVLPAVLQEVNGNKSKAARRLGVTRQTIIAQLQSIEGSAT